MPSKMKQKNNKIYEIELKDDEDEIKEIKENLNEIINLKKREKINNHNNEIIEETLYINKSNNKNGSNGVGFEILKIKSMKVPENPNDGITLNIILKKNNKLFIEDFNTKTEEIPSDYLAKFYEKFITENAPGFEYEKEMVFDI